MKFRTEVEPAALPFEICHNQTGLAIGSCFADNISAKLKAFKFNINANPFGVLYNPMSIANAFDMLMSDTSINRDVLFEQNGLWHSFNFHSSHSGSDPVEVAKQMNNSILSGRESLEKADYLIITFGTAWVYELQEDSASEILPCLDKKPSRVVANCHKLPANIFKRKRLTVDEIVQAYADLFNGDLREKNILLTVSPIRHIKDGLEENCVSKSILRIACSELSDMFANVAYFPSYEIMNDDLRDYRFYKADMVHPSDQAVDYIWEKFSRAAFTASTTALLHKIDKVNQAYNHRPFNPQTPQHQAFRDKMKNYTQQLAREIPQADFSQEISFFS